MLHSILTGRPAGKIRSRRPAGKILFEQAANGGDVLGGVALASFRRIYDIEASSKADGL